MSIINTDTQMKGNLVAQNPVEISGEFEGEIRSRSDVTIAPEGKVIGNIHAVTLVVQGTVQGKTILASRQLEIHEGGKFKADVVHQPDLIVLSHKIPIEDFSSREVK